MSGVIERAYACRETGKHRDVYLVIEVRRDEYGRPKWAQHHRFVRLGPAWTFLGQNQERLAPNFDNRLPLSESS